MNVQKIVVFSRHINFVPFQILIGMINLITLNYDQYKFIYKICFTFSVVKVINQYKHITKSNTINNHRPSPTT